jgi:hypothetical protein
MTVQPHRPHAGILLQLGLSNNPVIGLVGAPDLILGFAVTDRQQKNNLIAAPPNIAGGIILSIADGLPYSETMRSHDELLSVRLSKSTNPLVFHHDQPCTMMKYMAIEAPIRTAISVRTSGSLLQGRWSLLNTSSFIVPVNGDL